MDAFLASQFGHIVFVVMAGVMAAAGGIFVYKRATARHHALMDVARFLSSQGMERCPKALECIALGDVVGAAHEVRELDAILKDPVKRDLEFDGLFKRMLASRLANTQTRQQTLDEIAKAMPATPALVSAAAPLKAAA